jgi:hypothetical protein
LFAQNFGWRLANEVENPREFRDLARSVVGEGSTPSEEGWRDASSALLSRIGAMMLEESRASDEVLTNQALLSFVVERRPEELAPYVTGSAVGSLANEKEQKILQSVRFSFIKSMESLCDIPDGDFSFRKWMNTGPKDQWLFLAIPNDAAESYRRVVAIVIDVMIRAAMRLDENNNPAGVPVKTWLVVDELDSMGEIPSLILAVTRLRKFSVSVIAAIQDFAQLETRYGRTKAATLLNNFTWKLILRTVSHDLAVRLSKEIGSARYEITRKNSSWSKTREDQGSVGGSINVEERDEVLVMPEEIQALPTGRGYLILPCRSERVRVTVPNTVPKG